MVDPTDAWSGLQQRRRRSAGLPVVTGIDAGGRAELSAASLENAAAKIANALLDELDLAPGAVVGVDLPLHWQRSAWCAGVWTAGCVLAPGAVDADLIVCSPERAASLLERGAGAVGVVSRHPLGLPPAEPLPAGAADLTLAVRQQPDAYLHAPPRGDEPALRTDAGELTQQQALDEARRLARDWGLDPQGRLLVGPTLATGTAWLAVLAVPLVADASAVLAADGDPDGRIATQERVTAVAR